jgi:hypothetical protein
MSNRDGKSGNVNRYSSVCGLMWLMRCSEVAALMSASSSGFARTRHHSRNPALSYRPRRRRYHPTAEAGCSPCQGKRPQVQRPAAALVAKNRSRRRSAPSSAAVLRFALSSDTRRVSNPDQRLGATQPGARTPGCRRPPGFCRRAVSKTRRVGGGGEVDGTASADQGRLPALSRRLATDAAATGACWTQKWLGVRTFPAHDRARCDRAHTPAFGSSIHLRMVLQITSS